MILFMGIDEQSSVLPGLDSMLVNVANTLGHNEGCLFTYH